MGYPLDPDEAADRIPRPGETVDDRPAPLDAPEDPVRSYDPAKTSMLSWSSQGIIPVSSPLTQEPDLDSGESCAEGDETFPSLEMEASLASEPRWVEDELLLKKKVGEGGFGEVWEAVQVPLGRTVAVKRLKRQLFDEHKFHPFRIEALRHAFRQEGLTTANLDHPNIVPIHNLGTDVEGRPVLTMKFVRGRPWDAIIAEDFGAMSVSDFLIKHIPTLISMANAVAFAHSRGFVHRDLKPSQVMVGEFGEVYLMDWGLSVIYDEGLFASGQDFRMPEMAPTLDRAQNPAGTFGFMAPEQTAEDAGKIGPWTDVYLLGGTLYYLLTGRIPHPGSTPEQAFLQATKGIVPKPSRANPDREAPEELVEVAMRAMSPAIESRTPDARAFIRQLQEYLSGSQNRKESERLSEQVRKQFIEGEANYLHYARLLEDLGRARSQWAGNPQEQELRQQVNIAFITLALKEGDIALARMLLVRIEDEEIRTHLNEQIVAAEAKTRARDRSRRVIMAFSLTLIAALLAVAYWSTVYLTEARNEAETQRAIALERSRSAQQLLGFILGEHNRRLDLQSPREQELARELMQRMVNYFRTTDASRDSPQGREQTATLKDELGMQLLRLDMIEQARPLFNEAHAIRVSLLGERHPLVAEVAMHRAIAAARAEDGDGARTMAAQAIQAMERSNGAESLAFARGQLLLAHLHQVLGEQELSRAARSSAFDIVRRIYRTTAEELDDHEASTLLHRYLMDQSLVVEALLLLDTGILFREHGDPKGNEQRTGS